MNDIKQTADFLQNVPLFHGLNDRHLEHLAMRMVQRQYSAGQPIATQGHGSEGFFVIAAGKAEAFRQRSDEEKVAVNTFGATISERARAAR